MSRLYNYRTRKTFRLQQCAQASSAHAAAIDIQPSKADLRAMLADAAARTAALPIDVQPAATTGEEHASDH